MQFMMLMIPNVYRGNKKHQRCPAAEGDVIEIRQIFGEEDFANG